MIESCSGTKVTCSNAGMAHQSSRRMSQNSLVVTSDSDALSAAAEGLESNMDSTSVEGRCCKNATWFDRRGEDKVLSLR